MAARARHVAPRRRRRARSRGRLGGHTARAAGDLAAEPADRGPDRAHVAVLDVDGLGPGPHVLLQRRLPPRHPRRKYPWALGRPRREVWAEIWDDIGPRIAHGHETGVATWDEGLLLFLERSGYPEETYHTFSYSPLTDDDGGVAGMLCVVSEDTERVIGAAADADAARPRLATAPPAAPRPRCSPTSAGSSAPTRRTLPFALVYLFDDGRRRRGSRRHRLHDGPPGAPRRARSVRPVPTAPVAGRRGDRRGRSSLVDDLADRFAELPTGGLGRAAGAGARGAAAAAGPGGPYGFLVVGAQPVPPARRGYRGFVRPGRRPDRREHHRAPAPTSSSGAGPRRWPSSTRPRPTSSPTSATSSAPR